MFAVDYLTEVEGAVDDLPRLRDIAAEVSVNHQLTPPERDTILGRIEEYTHTYVQGHDLQEADFTPSLHPRDRKGRFRDKLFHGTLRSTGEYFAKGGYIEPQVGKFVRDAYGDEYDRIGAKITPVVSMANEMEIGRARTAIKSQVGFELGKRFQDVTTEDIEKHGALAVIDKPPGVGHITEDEYGYVEVPESVEPGDYFTTFPVKAETVLTGKDMMDFFDEHGLHPLKLDEKPKSLEGPFFSGYALLDKLKRPRDLTPEEIGFLESYQVGGDEAEELNRALRDNDQNSYHKEYVAALDSIFEKKLPLKDPAIVYHGFKADVSLPDVGGTFNEPGYLSTAVTREVAGAFGDKVVSIEVPTGTKMIDVGGITGHPEEDEVLLPRGLTFRMTGPNSMAVVPDESSRLDTGVATPERPVERTPNVPIDAAVQEAVRGADSAATYLEDKLGVKAKLDGTEKDDATYWQEIVQAVKDATTMFPVLQNGKLEGIQTMDIFEDEERERVSLNAIGQVDFMSGMGQKEFERAVWAQTGRNPEDGPSNIGTSDGKPNWITLTGVRHEANTTQELESALSGDLTRADVDPYGRMMHELGHAVVNESGVRKVMTDFLNDTISPPEMQRVSFYGSRNPDEAWAEIFVTLNKQGALGELGDDVRRSLKELARTANKWAADNGVPGGRVL